MVTGKSFGDVGVISNAPRTANCVAFIPTKILEIGRNLFKKTIGDGMLADKRNKFKALMKVPLFDTWSEPSVLGLLTHAKVIYPKYDTYLYRQGSIDNSIYIILKGEVQVRIELIKLDFECATRKYS